MFARLLFSGLFLVLIGCGSPTPPKLSVDEYVQKKIDAMTKIADAAESANPDFAVKAAVENYRKIPFQAKTQPEAARKILEIYEQRLKGKLKGEAADEVAGEVEILINEMK